MEAYPTMDFKKLPETVSCRRSLMFSRNKKYSVFILCCLAAEQTFFLTRINAQESSNETSFTQPQDAQNAPYIKDIIVVGSRTFPEVTLKSKLPYHVGEQFWPEKSNQAIFNIHKLGHFKQVELKVEKLDKNSINLYVIVTEKPILKDVLFVGNKNLSKKDITKKIDFDTIPAAEEQELKKFIRIIKNAYIEKGYLFAEITLSTKNEDGQIIATFTVKEGPIAHVKRVRFTGNTHFNEKKLRSLLFTREDWPLGPLDRAGTYHPLALENDKLTLENFYQSNGYPHARVTEAHVDFANNNKEINVTFDIHEGEFYTIGNVSAPGNDLFTEEQLLYFLPLRKGAPYSREMIRSSIELLRTIWGDQGYIYADIEPMIQPNPNEDIKTIDVSFNSYLGGKVKLNRINIFGNLKTRNKVIRRQFLIDEGQELTTSKLEASKNRIGGLGYFDPKEGVNWKLNRIDDDFVDLDMMLKEIKTGRLEFKITYGGSPASMSSTGGIAGEVQYSERNLLGHGLVGNLTTRIGAEERSISGGLAQPWLFDKPIHIGVDGYYSRSDYDELKKVVNGVKEQRGGGLVNLGFVSSNLFYTSFNLQTGFTKLDYYSSSRDGTTNVMPEASIVGDMTVKDEYQTILTNRFQSGTFAYVQLDSGQDTRNHNTHITRGSKWLFTNRFGFPTLGNTFGFYKIEFDGHWYTPLINETDLVLHLHTHFGVVNSYGKNSIPYRELYHIGGQASVRGWEFGQVSPQWFHPALIEDEGWQGDSIGAKKAAFFNVELIFPFTEDLGIKGVVFYDGGSGWDTPNASSIPTAHLRNNSFDYRHSIGFGIRMLQPQPMRVDWGFKLDKRSGETSGEVSFSSYYDF